ncbi:hypothetical protein V1478_015760 [Vespula squamosa]|uniref:Uncharacterized protein n=1 Tax=Vespula squamosa TaxID=30214 RepID=A0ABD2A4E3_VESSQ
MSYVPDSTITVALNWLNDPSTYLYVKSIRARSHNTHWQVQVYLRARNPNANEFITGVMMWSLRLFCDDKKNLIVLSNPEPIVTLERGH